MQSVLSKAKVGDLKSDPFPHLVITDALDGAYYEELMSAFPSIETINAKRRKLTNNDDTYLGAIDALDAPEISTEWKEFIRFHTSMYFL